MTAPPILQEKFPVEYTWIGVAVGLFSLIVLMISQKDSWWFFSLVAETVDVVTPSYDRGKALDIFIEYSQVIFFGGTTYSGQILSISALVLVLYFSGSSLTLYLIDNIASVTSLLPFDDITYVNPQIFNQGLTGIGDPLRGIEVRMTLSGDGCGTIPGATSPSSGAVSWKYASSRCSSASNTYQHIWSCTTCIFPPVFNFDVSLSPSCQSMIVELGAVSAEGDLTIASTGPIVGDENGYLSSIEVSTQPLFSYVNNIVRASRSRKGYSLSIKDKVIKRSEVSVR